jgi:4-amino-4-deoxy-L-arabinose transferase-like glycosyltransferase
MMYEEFLRQTDMKRQAGEWLAWVGVATLWLVHATVNTYWLLSDTRPPAWDQAGHILTTLRMLNALWTLLSHPLSSLGTLMGTSAPYPPLFYWTSLPLCLWRPCTVDLALGANVLFMGVLLFSTYSLGRRLEGRSAGLLAAFLVSVYPVIFGLSREYLLDFALTAMVSLSIATLLKTEGFRIRNWSLICGLALGLGMLTKWSLTFFVAAPLALAAWRALRQPSGHARTNVMIALGLAGIISLPWYLYNLRTLREFFGVASKLHAVLEGDPTGVLASSLWYLQSLVNNQITLGFVLLFACGLVSLALRRPQQAWGLIILWIVVPFIYFTIYPNKDTRYIVPMLPAAALVSATALTNMPSRLTRRALVGLMVAWGSFIFMTITFGQDRVPVLRWLPPRAYVTVAGKGWFFYNSTYQFASPPARQNWQQETILEDIIIDAVTRPGRAGQRVNLLVLPNTEYFHGNTFSYCARLQRQPVEVYNISGVLPLDSAYLHAAACSDYIVDKTGDKGPEWTLRYVSPISRGLHDPTDSLFVDYQLIQTYLLPDGSTAELFRRRGGP